MYSESKKLPAPDTLPKLLLAFTSLSGEFPISAVRRLPGAESYMAQVAKQLKKEELLRTYYRDSLRGLRLTSTAKCLMINSQPQRFTQFISGNMDRLDTMICLADNLTRPFLF